jgi:hypothetical protein
MASWSDVAAAAPDLAEKVQARFEATGLAFLATLRRDGSPRITGIEPGFWDGDLWLGMMDGSLKALDLRRDPRLALHAATVDKEVKEGDAKIAGRAVEVGDDEKVRFLAGTAADGAEPPPPGPMHLFRVDVTEASFLVPAGDHLAIEIWTERAGARTVDRY